MSKKTENIKRKKNKRKSIKRKGIKHGGAIKNKNHTNNQSNTESNTESNNQSNLSPTKGNKIYMTTTDKEKVINNILQKKEGKHLSPKQQEKVEKFYTSLSGDIQRKHSKFKSTEIENNSGGKIALIAFLLLGGTLGIHAALKSL
jgi:hypothetical protein